MVGRIPRHDETDVTIEDDIKAPIDKIVQAYGKLVTSDTHFVVFMEARSEKPSMELNRREDLAPVL